MSTVHYGPDELGSFLALIVRARAVRGSDLRLAVTAKDAAELRRWFDQSGMAGLVLAYQRANARAFNAAYAHRISAGDWPKARSSAITNAHLLRVAEMVLDARTDWRWTCEMACLLRYNLDGCATKEAIRFCADVSDAAVRYLMGDQ